MTGAGQGSGARGFCSGKAAEAIGVDDDSVRTVSSNSRRQTWQ